MTLLESGCCRGKVERLVAPEMNGNAIVSKHQVNLREDKRAAMCRTMNSRLSRAGPSR